MFNIFKIHLSHQHLSSIKYLVFLLYLVTGIIVFDDYGISWDENTQRNTGIVFSKDFCDNLGTSVPNPNSKIPELGKYGDREFGAAFEMALFGIERLLKLNDTRDVFLMRHLINFMVFAFSLLVFWIIIENKTRNWLWGLAGFLMVGLHPRLFADAFYNSKDIILMSFFIFTLYFVERFFRDGKRSHLIGAGILSAFAFNIRPAGILIPVTMIAIMIFFSLSRKRFRQKCYKSVITNSLLLTIVFAGFVIFFNSYLWSEPLLKSWEILNKFLNYKLAQTAGNTFFMGTFIPANNIPWFYSFVWIYISTPFFMILVSIIGLFAQIRFWKHAGKLDYFVFIWLMAPIILIIISKSTLYDAWRHLFFIFPAIVASGILGLNQFFERYNDQKFKSLFKIRRLIVILALFSTIEGLSGIIRCHPYQYCYFNFTVAHPEKKYELDYWGLSYIDHLKFLLAHDKSEKIMIKALNLPAFHNAYLLKPDDRKRICFDNSIVDEYQSRLGSFYPVGEPIRITKKNEYPDYFISNFRNTSGNIELFKYFNNYPPYDKPINTIRCGDKIISGTYSLE